MPRFKTVARVLYGLLFVAAGLNHVISPAFYLKIMPPALPFPEALNYIAGLAEIVLGVMLILPRTSRLAAWGLIALLIAVFPANVYMAMHPERFTEIHPFGRDVPLTPAGIYARLPFQAVFIALAYWFTRRPDESRRR